MAERTLRILNKILDTIIAIVLILAVLYSVYSLWDNYQLYQGIHDLQVKLKDLKPKGKKYPLKIFAVLVVRSTDSYIFDPSQYKNNRQHFYLRSMQGILNIHMRHNILLIFLFL